MRGCWAPGLSVIMASATVKYGARDRDRDNIYATAIERFTGSSAMFKCFLGCWLDGNSVVRGFKTRKEMYQERSIQIEIFTGSSAMFNGLLIYSLVGHFDVSGLGVQKEIGIERTHCAKIY